MAIHSYHYFHSAMYAASKRCPDHNSGEDRWFHLVKVPRHDFFGSEHGWEHGQIDRRSSIRRVLHVILHPTRLKDIFHLREAEEERVGLQTSQELQSDRSPKSSS